MELRNGAIDVAGRSLGLAPDAVRDAPKDDGAVLFQTVRRLKVLERPVVILCELPDPATATGPVLEWLDQLLYTALTRATTHLVIIVPPSLAERLPGGPTPMTASRVPVPARGGRSVSRRVQGSGWFQPSGTTERSRVAVTAKMTQWFRMIGTR